MLICKWAAEYSEPGIPIFDCKFSKNGEYAWSSDGDGVKIRDSNHDFLQSLTLPTIDAKKLIFDKNENILHVLTNEAEIVYPHMKQMEHE